MYIPYYIPSPSIIGYRAVRFRRSRGGSGELRKCVWQNAQFRVVALCVFTFRTGEFCLPVRKIILQGMVFPPVFW